MNTTMLRDSFAMIVERNPEPTVRFYEILFERYPQAKPLFSRNRPDVQATMLRDALVAVVDHLDDAPWLGKQLGALGAKHQDYGVTEPMYDWVGDALLATFAEIAGERWSPELAAAWTEAYAAVRDLMLAGTTGDAELAS